MQEMESRLAFETLISDLSSTFIDLSPGEVDLAIEDALRCVCTLLGIDLAVLWQWSSAAPDVIAPTHAYPPVAEVLPPEPLEQEQFPWIRQEILAGRVVALSSLGEFPADADVDREFCRHFGVKSHLSLPMAVGGEPPVGLLGLNTLHLERDWPDAVVEQLQLVTRVFANALARKRADQALRDSEERLSLAADAAEAGLWILDYTADVVWATAKARAIFGFSPDEVISVARLRAAIHPDDRGLVLAAIERSARTGEALGMEARIATGEGDVRWIMSRGRAHASTTGQPERVMGVSIDISERKGEQEALRVSAARLASASELAGLAFYEIDYGEGTFYIDDRFRDLCGIPAGLERGLEPLDFWMEHLHPDDAPGVMEVRRQLHEGGRDRFSHEYRYLHPTRGVSWIQHLAVVATRDAAGGAVRTYGVFRDVTDRKHAEDELRDLSRRLIRAHEEERALLARELHDDVSQRLAVLAIDVGRLEIAAPDDTQAAAMQSVREGLVCLSDDIHSLAYQLHPSVLEELGLGEALRAEGERCARQGLHVWVHLDELPGALPDGIELCLFRVVQEALSNVLHHAAANFATVRLRRTDGGLYLAISDDGVGFDREELKERMRLGLLSMRERVRLVNGSFHLESTPGEGTTIAVWVPVLTEGTSR